MSEQRGIASVSEAVEKKYILIVEDDPDTGTLLVLALEQYTLLTALLVKSSAEALRIVQETIPVLLLLDYYLGDLNGLELFDQLHSMVGLEAVPTLMMSAGTLPPEGKQQIGARQIVFLSKPFDLDELFETIDALLARRATDELIC